MNIEKLASPLLQRSVIMTLLIFLQTAMLLLCMPRFPSDFICVYQGCMVLSILAILIIVSRQTDPEYKIVWIIPILPFPAFGWLVCLLCGSNKLSARRRRKVRGMDHIMLEQLERDYKAEELRPFGADAANQARYLKHYTRCPIYTNIYTHYFPLGDDVFPAMLEELRKVEKYIFLEYLIVSPGIFQDSMVETLKEKHAAGVDVRMIYDDVGSLDILSMDYARKFEAETGIPCCYFNRFKPVISIRMSNRGHREFCIVDGHTAFTGGANLTDKYINQKLRYGHWRDTAILLKGETVWSMTVMFLTMWEYTRGVEEGYRRFRLDKLPPKAAQGTGYCVQPYADNPLDEEAVGEVVYLNLINRAECCVHAMMPYLIISDSISTALCNAAKSGMDVRIITPHIPGKALAFGLTRSHYESLLEVGVQTFEYTSGFVHAKVTVTDDYCGVVDSINLDYRSMFLHFEDAMLLCHDPTILDIKRDFINTQFRSQPVTLEQCLDHSWIRHLFRSVLRMLTPLL